MIGRPPFAIMFSHVLPNVLGPVLVIATLLVFFTTENKNAETALTPRAARRSARARVSLRERPGRAPSALQ